MRPHLALLVLTAALLLGGCSGADTAETDTAAPSSHDDAEPTEVGGLGAAATPDEDRPDTEPAALPAAARTGDRLIKEGVVTVEVAAGGFDAAFQRVVAAATALGGSVVASTSTSTDDGGTSGSVTVRVPVDRYEDLLVGVGRVGDVRSREITATDVTTEFTDLESRLRHARAQERFYLGLLDRAESVADAIAVQQQLDGIQSTIEQLQGRLQLLDDRTTFSTLTVELIEPGATPVRASGDRPALAHYAQTARDAFVVVVGWTLVVGVALAPLLLPLLAAGLVWRWSTRRRHPATVAADS